MRFARHPCCTGAWFSMATEATTELRVRIQPFDPAGHDRATFFSGAGRIDNFLKRTARKHQKGDFSRIWVATRPGESRVLGYYAINAHAIEAEDLPSSLVKGAPGHGYVPAACLSMVGVDQSVQGRGLGRALLVDALRRLEIASRTVGIKAIVLDVLEDGGSIAFAKRQRFYERMGFVPFPSRPSRMFIAMATVRSGLAD